MSHDRSDADPRPVLVVEDCDDDFDTVVEAASLAHLGNRLVRAGNAAVARRLLERDRSGAFAFMLLDHNLPGQDGLAFLETMRGDALLVGLPTVVFTTSGNPRDRDAFYRAGANAFHVKNVQHAVCLHTLESIFDQWLNPAAAPPAARRP